MKKSTYSEERIAFAMRQAERKPTVAEAYGNMGFSNGSWRYWKKRIASRINWSLT